MSTATTIPSGALKVSNLFEQILSQPKEAIYQGAQIALNGLSPEQKEKFKHFRDAAHYAFRTSVNDFDREGFMKRSAIKRFLERYRIGVTDLCELIAAISQGIEAKGKTTCKIKLRPLRAYLEENSKKMQLPENDDSLTNEIHSQIMQLAA